MSLDERLNLYICVLDTGHPASVGASIPARSQHVGLSLPHTCQSLLLPGPLTCCGLCHTSALPCLATLPSSQTSVEDIPSSRSFPPWPPGGVNTFFLCLQVLQLSCLYISKAGLAIIKHDENVSVSNCYKDFNSFSSSPCLALPVRSQQSRN